MVPPGAYEVLVRTLERSRSDFVCGNVNRIGPWGISQSALHARAIKGRRTATHITKMPQLLYDVSVFNKLFRKDFWDAHRLSFPEGMLWEDIQLMTRAHVLARAVDVIPDHIYYWRERGLGELSITQSRTNISNLRDRIDALLAIDGFLAGHAPAACSGGTSTRRSPTTSGCTWVTCTRSATTTAENPRPRGPRPGPGQASRGGEAPAAENSPTARLSGARCRRLLARLTWRPAGTGGRATDSSAGVADCSPTSRCAVTRLRIPAKSFRPASPNSNPSSGSTRSAGGAAKLAIEGRGDIPSIDICERRHSSKIVVLRRRYWCCPPIILPARSILDPDATEESGQARDSYDWAGLRCEISPRWSASSAAGRPARGSATRWAAAGGAAPSPIQTPRPG